MILNIEGHSKEYFIAVTQAIWSIFVSLWCTTGYVISFIMGAAAGHPAHSVEKIVAEVTFHNNVISNFKY